MPPSKRASTAVKLSQPSCSRDGPSFASPTAAPTATSAIAAPSAIFSISAWRAAPISSRSSRIATPTIAPAATRAATSTARAASRVSGDAPVSNASRRNGRVGREADGGHGQRDEQAQALAHHDERDRRGDRERVHRAAALAQRADAERADAEAERGAAQRRVRAAPRRQPGQRPEADEGQRGGRVGIAGRPGQAVVEEPVGRRIAGQAHRRVDAHGRACGRGHGDDGHGVGLAADGQQDARERGRVEQRARGLGRGGAGEQRPRRRERGQRRQRQQARRRHDAGPAPRAQRVEQQRAAGGGGDHDRPGVPVAVAHTAVGAQREAQRRQRRQREERQPRAERAVEPHLHGAIPGPGPGGGSGLAGRPARGAPLLYSRGAMSFGPSA